MIANRKRRRVGYAGLGLRGLRGFGDLVHGVQEENCTLLPFQQQYDCAQRNMSAVDASYAEHPGSYLGNGVYAGTAQAAAIYGPPPTTYAPAPSYTPSYVPAPPAPPAPQYAAPTPPPVQPPPIAPGSTPAAAQKQAAAPTPAAFSIDSIPWWGWLAGGAGAIFLLKGQR